MATLSSARLRPTPISHIFGHSTEHWPITPPLEKQLRSSRGHVNPKVPVKRSPSPPPPPERRCWVLSSHRVHRELGARFQTPDKAFRRVWPRSGRDVWWTWVDKSGEKVHIVALVPLCCRLRNSHKIPRNSPPQRTPTGRRQTVSGDALRPNDTSILDLCTQLGLGTTLKCLSTPPHIKVSLPLHTCAPCCSSVVWLYRESEEYSSVEHIQLRSLSLGTTQPTQPTHPLTSTFRTRLSSSIAPTTRLYVISLQ